MTSKTKSVVVVHDLAYIHHPEYVSPKNREWLKKYVPKSIENAAKIITVSENTKKEVSEFYGVDKEKIFVITPAVDHEHFKKSSIKEIDDIKTKFGITKPYILSVGTIEPRKNLIGVLDAFELLPEKTKHEYSLVLVGASGWLDDAIQRKYDELSRKYSIIKTGYVDDGDLPALYSGAEVFVYPSFYEGFGIPPLEAMACGTPVIVSNNSSLPEVVGEAGIATDATDTDRLSTEIENILSDKKLAERLSKAGLNQSIKFSWDKSADKLISLIKSI